MVCKKRPPGRFFFAEGKLPGTIQVMKKKSGKSGGSTAFKIKLRGKDSTPLSMPELQQGLYESARRLKPLKDYRVKWATLYLTVVDENGEEVVLDRKGEWIIYPYQSAADDAGL